MPQPDWQRFNDELAQSLREFQKARVWQSQATQQEGKTEVSRREDIRTRLAALEAEYAQLTRFPEDNFADGTVVCWTKTEEVSKFEMGTLNTVTEARRYTYAAIRGNGQWWTTSKLTKRKVMTWDELCEFVGDDELWTMTNNVCLTDPAQLKSTATNA